MLRCEMELTKKKKKRKKKWKTQGKLYFFLNWGHFILEEAHFQKLSVI